MVATFDDVDRVDLDIAEMPDRGGHGIGSCAKGRVVVEPLRAQPQAPCIGLTDPCRLTRHRPGTDSHKSRPNGLRLEPAAETRHRYRWTRATNN